MSVVILIGRIMFAMIFMGSGVAGHLMSTDDTVAYAEMRGVKNARLLTQVSGVFILLEGLAVILGIWLDLAALGIAAYVLITGFMIHHFWTDDDPMTQQAEMTQFMKNLSIAGGALILFGFAAASGGDLGLTLTDPLFDFNF